MPLASVPGYSVLSTKRTLAVYLQPSLDAFKVRWDAMTGGLLKGLDWTNLFVAGGIVLGALLTPELPSEHAEFPQVNKADEWSSSDIDMYIYGLSPPEANAKIRHIAETYQKNIPQGAPFLVVRNSQTITIYSEWPRRRLQIVLKLIGSPRDVLLNFDLDICACGWDGSELWMLPRCARALESMRFLTTVALTSIPVHGSPFSWHERLYHGPCERPLPWGSQGYPRQTVRLFSQVYSLAKLFLQSFQIRQQGLWSSYPSVIPGWSAVVFFARKTRIRRSWRETPACIAPPAGS